VAQQLVVDQLLNDYAPSDDQADALRSLVGGLQDDGTQVVLLLLPVTEDYLALHPDGAADYDAFADTVQQIGDDAGVEVVDAHEWAPGDQVFADTHHLNGFGSEAFSTALPALLPDAVDDTGC
jgi:hypothetical protein